MCFAGIEQDAYSATNTSHVWRRTSAPSCGADQIPRLACKGRRASGNAEPLLPLPSLGKTTLLLSKAVRWLCKDTMHAQV